MKCCVLAALHHFILNRFILLASISIGLLGTTASVNATETAPKAPREIKIGVEATYPPFEFKAANGQLQGFDIDIGNAICAKLQAKCVWVEQPFDSLIPGLQARKFDLIHSNINATETRRRAIDFTQDIYNVPSQLIARADSKLSTVSANTLKGKRIGVLQGSTQETYAKAHWGTKGVQIISYADHAQTFADLRAGRIDGALQESQTAMDAFLRKPEGANFAFVGKPIEDKQTLSAGIAIGIRKSDNELKMQVNKAISQLKTDGTLRKIADQYFLPGGITLLSPQK